MPIFLVDPSGNLLFYNEPAEQLLGSRYDETGEMSVSEWSSLFAPIGEDGVSRKIGATAFPLEGQGGRQLGAVGIFWEQP